MSEKEVRRSSVSYTGKEFNQDTLNLVERLGIESIHQPSATGHSDYARGDFVDAISTTKNDLDKLAGDYARQNNRLGPDLDKIVEEDKLTSLAQERGWEGLVEPAVYSSGEMMKTYLEFRNGWQKIKRDYFIGLVQQYWDETKATHGTTEVANPGILKLGIKQYAKIAGVVGTVASVLTGLVMGGLYFFLIKPDIEKTKRETTNSVFYMMDSKVDGVYDQLKDRMMEDFSNVEIPEEILMDAFNKLRPEIRKETQQGQFNFEEWYTEFKTRLKKDFPLLNGFQGLEKKEEKNN
ncbi:hypothetical protein ACFLZB_04860 [Nanoarchaeota archaeon]